MIIQNLGFFLNFFVKKSLIFYQFVNAKAHQTYKWQKVFCYTFLVVFLIRLTKRVSNKGKQFKSTPTYPSISSQIYNNQKTGLVFCLKQSVQAANAETKRQGKLASRTESFNVLYRDICFDRILGRKVEGSMVSYAIHIGSNKLFKFSKTS